MGPSVEVLLQQTACNRISTKTKYTLEGKIEIQR